MINLNLKRIFVIGDTSTGKTTSTINHVLESGVNVVYYVTSKKIDLNDKEQYVRTHTFKDYHYDTLYHDSERIISLNKNSEYKFHLMTIEKALYYFLNNGLEENAVVILDEIDSISQNKNYELLVAWLNTKNPNNTIIYISATINKDRLIKELGDFFMLDRSNPDSVVDMGKFKRNVSVAFIKTKNYKKSLEQEIQTYANNPIRFNQTIFLIPSKPYIRKLLNSDLLKSLYVFRRTNKKVAKSLEKVNKEHNLSDDVVFGLRHNIGIIDALSSHEDREFVLNLFNSGVISVLFATNVIERGINVLANTIVIFESRYVRWDDNQILNMFGRLNRSIGGKTTDRMGYFMLFSEQRSDYDFNKIYERNYMIKSCLRYSDVYFFYKMDKNIISHLINKYDEKKFSVFDHYEQYFDSIRFSLNVSQIRKVSREFSIFLNFIPNKANTSNERILNSIFMKVGGGKSLFNSLRYLYFKLYRNFMSGKINSSDYVEKVKSLATTYVNKNIKLAITSLYGNKLVRDEERVAMETAKNKTPIGEIKSIFLFNRKKPS